MRHVFVIECKRQNLELHKIIIATSELRKCHLSHQLEANDWLWMKQVCHNESQFITKRVKLWRHETPYYTFHMSLHMKRVIGCLSIYLTITNISVWLSYLLPILRLCVVFSPLVLTSHVAHTTDINQMVSIRKRATTEQCLNSKYNLFTANHQHNI